jgi:hypothetical protein
MMFTLWPVYTPRLVSYIEYDILNVHMTAASTAHSPAHAQLIQPPVVGKGHAAAAAAAAAAMTPARVSNRSIHRSHDSADIKAQTHGVDILAYPTSLAAYPTLAYPASP